MEVSDFIKEKVSDFRRNLSYNPIHSLDGKKGWIEAVDHSDSKERLKMETSTGTVAYSKEKQYYELKRATKGIVLDGIFVPDEGQEVKYMIAVNEYFEKEFKTIKN